MINMTNQKETLFYPESVYEGVVKTLSHLNPYIECDFVIVGGIANRKLFPDWAEGQKEKKFNDIDVMLLPQEMDIGNDLLNSEIKKKFYVMYVYRQFDGYYIALMDKATHVMVDIFTRPREIETQEIVLDGAKFNVLSNEEIYLSNLRNIYETLSRGWVLDPKHLVFRKYLEEKVDFEGFEAIWKKEKSIIRFKTENYSFETFDEYLEQINRLQIDKKELIHEKEAPKGERKYDDSCVEAYGVQIEDKVVFDRAFEEKDEVNNNY